MCCKHIYFLLLNCISDYVRCKEWADLGRFVPTLLIKKVRHYKAQTWTHNARHPISNDLHDFIVQIYPGVDAPGRPL